VGTGIRIPLRVLLPCLAVSLTVVGAVALGLAGLAAAHGDLVRHTDSGLLACTGGVLRRGVVAPPGSSPLSGQVPPGDCGTELLNASGQVLTLTAPGPVFPAGSSWLTAHLGRPVTVPATGWRVVIESVRYQPRRIPYVYGPDNVKYVISGQPGPGSRGMLVVMAGLGADDRIAGRFAAGYAAAAGIVLVLVAGAARALTRATVRPLRQAAKPAERAGNAAAAEQLRARHTADTAARQAVDEISIGPIRPVPGRRRAISAPRRPRPPCR